MLLHDLLHCEALELRKNKLLQELKGIEEETQRLLGKKDDEPEAPAESVAVKETVETEPEAEAAPQEEDKPVTRKSSKTS